MLKDKANLRSVTGRESDAEAQGVVAEAWGTPGAVRAAADAGAAAPAPGKGAGQGEGAAQQAQEPGA